MVASHCGFFAVIGAPNVGKSTLVNALVGGKVAIVTPKVQTTRMRVIGITGEGDAQLVFIDTPGIFKPRRRLDRAMVSAAWKGAREADGIILVVDANRTPSGTPDDETRAIARTLRAEGRRAILVLNKADVAKRENLLKLAAALDADGIFDKVFMISALTGDGLADLKGCLRDLAPEGPWHYPAEQMADLPLRLLAAEITREQLYLQLHQELPYAATVETERWEDFANGDVKIDQVIVVERDGQKAIIVGKRGRQIKELGAAARHELETVLGRKVHLFLTAQVREGWAEDPNRYRAIGLDFVE
ncbi:MAG: GTPase Era [Alphaproteobacteria bacterium]|nr:GTPase Era [Alphaproteobacteria bacterium]